MFTFIVLDGDADLPQYLLVYLADRRAQRPHGGGGVEVEDRHEILMAEILLRLQPTAGHQGIGDADSGGGFELDFDVVLIVLFQKGTVNDIEDVPLVFHPILADKLGRDAFKLFRQVVFGRRSKPLCERLDHRRLMLRAKLPQEGVA